METSRQLLLMSHDAEMRSTYVNFLNLGPRSTPSTQLSIVILILLDPTFGFHPLIPTSEVLYCLVRAPICSR
jgi:hypothetical protein